MTFSFPLENANHGYIRSCFTTPPPVGTIIQIRNSDNPEIQPGTFMVTAVTYQIDIVNNSITKDTGMGADIRLERQP